MKTQFYYFAGCPSSEKALANLKEALALERLSDTVETVEVTSAADAESCRFIGSPTIRIDGVDIEGPEAEERGYGFGCRVYADGASTRGWPSVDRIRQALRARSSGTP